MSEKYKVGDSQIPHFITVTVIRWLPLFKDTKLAKIIIESLKHCQENKGLILHAWCIMPSHLHLIGKAQNSNSIPPIIRDFKKYTSVMISRYLENESDPHNFLNILRSSGSDSQKHVKFQVWKSGYHPVELNTTRMLEQRLDYLQ